MTSYFPDVNVWLALSYGEHMHSNSAHAWLRQVTASDRLLFCRFTQLGLLRLITNAQVMKSSVLTIGDAFAAYDRWMADPRVEFAPEPRGLEPQFRRTCAPFARRNANQAVSDAYIAAFARSADATLVTFDRGLVNTARLQEAPVLELPGPRPAGPVRRSAGRRRRVEELRRRD